MANGLIEDLPKSDHLFLLVGTNPLPNWVAARLLTLPSARVYLICTSDVAEQTRRLQVALQGDEDHPLSVNWIETDGADERKIYDAVRKLAEGVRKEVERAWQEGKEGSVGLNYTGGTKMMSVHAHHALRDVFATLPNERQPIFSYLHAKDLEMKFDGASGQQPVPVSQYQKICLSAELLFQLQSDPKKFTYETLPRCATAAKGLATIHSHEVGQHVWRNRYRDLAQSKFSPQFFLPTETAFQEYIEESLNESAKKLNPRARSNLLQLMMDGYQQLLTGFQVSGGSSLEEVVKRNPHDFQDIRTLANWLNGLWLEHFTLAQLQACKDVQWNPGGLITNVTVKSESGFDFQSDVIALRGYQLFYFSCFTGSDLLRTKLKLLEAMVRATQFGGDEARAAVVSGVNDYTRVCQQAGADWAQGRTSGQFEVFGREHLPNLAEHISEWVNRCK